MKGSPQGFQAALQLEATITSSDEPDSLQYTKELFSFPIPDAGIEVEGIFKLGATLSYDIGVSSTFSGSATVDFGLQAGLPDSAQVTADIQNPGSSSATGWSGGSLTPLFDIKKESASVKLAAFSQPKLALGIELIEIGNFDVALAIKLPEVSVTLTAAYDEGGVCGVGSLKTGVKLDSEVEIGVDLEIDADLGDDEDTEKPSWSHTLYSYSIPLESKCFPLDIPGLNSSSTAKTPTTIASIASHTVAVSDSHRNSAGVQSHTSSIQPALSGPLSFPDLSDPNDIFAAIEPKSTTISPPSSSHPSSPSKLAAPKGADDMKAAVVHPKTTADTTPKKSSTPPAQKPKATPLPDPLPYVKPAVENSIEDLPPAAEKPVPFVPTTTSKRIPEATPTTPASGGGGCRMVKRFGKRMFVC